MLKSKFTLRQYQHAFIRELAVAIKQHRRIIGCAATGAGKSKTFLQIAANSALKRYTVLIITESRPIYDQLIAEVHATEINSTKKLYHILPGGIYLAMAQTLKRRPYLIEQFKTISEAPDILTNGLLIINDECHINQATGILKKLQNALVIGFSGSPVGKHLKDIYHHLVVGPQPHELVLNGYLTPYWHFERKRADISQLELDHAGEYTEESQENVFSTDAVYDGLIEDLTNPAFKWHKALIFTSSIKHCEETAERLRAAGLRCVTVHSKVDNYPLANNVKPKPNQTLEEAYLEQFTKGLTPICVSVGILTKGFDYPAIDLIAQLFKTTSLAKYLQTIGRASRVLPGEEDLPIEKRRKQRFYVFDYGQNCTKHFQWDFERDWQNIWRDKPKRAGVSPIKTCPQCDYVNAANAKTCVFCGYAWPVLTFDFNEEPPETILVEVTAKYNKLVGRKLSDLNPQELSDYAKTKGYKQLAIRVAKWHAFSKGLERGQPGRQWLKDYCAFMNYKQHWVNIQIDAMRAVLQSNPDEKFEFTDKVLR
jgi:superfamily II DNA or RNA helicase